MSILLGIDPGLGRTGYGVIHAESNTVRFIACGVVKGGDDVDIAPRLQRLSVGLQDILAQYRPDQAAIEETFVNMNGQSTLKLGQARGAILLTLAQAGLFAYEYAATLVKKTVTGSGRADKAQLSRMVQMQLPGCAAAGPDAMDALGIALCHAQHQTLAQHLRRAEGAR